MEDIKIRSLRESQKAKLEKAEDFFQKKIDLNQVPRVEIKRRKHLPRRIAHLLLLTVFVFAVGGLGGVWIDRILLPTILVKYPELNQYEYLKRVNERTTIVHETQDITISQEEAAADAIEKAQPTVAQILTKNAEGSYAPIGTGIVLTSDGYLLTPLKNVLSGTDKSAELEVKLPSGKTYAAEIKAQDSDYSLAILKIAENNLPVIPYANTQDLKLGQKLIIIDDAIQTDIVSKIITDYRMPNSTDSSFQKRIQIVQNLGTASTGAAVINLEGQLVGVGQEANLVIPLSEIKGFIEKSTAQQ